MLANITARQKLIDATRMEDAAVTAGRSAEALFGYLSRLDTLRGSDLSDEALADRAFEAELHMRTVLSAGMDALNELNDLGLMATSPTDEEIKKFNETKLTEAFARMTRVLGQRMPNQRWGWLEKAVRLLEGLEVRIERDQEGFRGIVSENGRTRVVRISQDAPSSRISTRAFFSDGPDRVYVPTSMIFETVDGDPEPVSAYYAAISGMAFAREWIYRHARNATELGRPERTGGGPVVAVIAIVLVVALAIATVTAAILGIICATGDQDACELAAYFGIAVAVLTPSSKYADDKAKQLQYGTNQQ